MAGRDEDSILATAVPRKALTGLAHFSMKIVQKIVDFTRTQVSTRHFVIINHYIYVQTQISRTQTNAEWSLKCAKLQYENKQIPRRGWRAPLLYKAMARRLPSADNA